MLKYFILTVISASIVFLSVHYDLDSIYENTVSLLFSVGRRKEEVRLLGENDLSLYNGESDSNGLYLSVLGQVFDVSRGREHYGPGGGYHLFAGKDASRAFVTGDFSETGQTDDLSGLSPEQIVALFDWLAFYQKEYKPVGRLIGRYYSENGEPTTALREVEEVLAEGLKLKAEAQAQKKRFPSCNSAWSDASSGRVWCSTMSGGVHRSWVGVPRKLFSLESWSFRCVCVQSEDPTALNSPLLQEYEDCPSLAESCPVNTL
ncbi:neuferricin isoform X1 [Anguilla anguilla]|uniref:neuferricin isoform X1 n=1 Tax=Anguilla anguilla TaxID=7936 RepID=UPI0015AFAA73|nr:neuferricin isoform X1 [Anguilla anguilla]